MSLSFMNAPHHNAVDRETKIFTSQFSTYIEQSDSIFQVHIGSIHVSD